MRKVARNDETCLHIDQHLRKELVRYSFERTLNQKNSKLDIDQKINSHL